MIRGITFGKQLTMSKDFAHFQNTFLDGSSGITKGCRVSNDTNNVYISEGYFVVAGRFVNITGIETIEVEPLDRDSEYCKLVFEIDLSKDNEIDVFRQGYFKILRDYNAYPSITQEDLDAGGTLYQMQFAQFKNSTSGISDFVDISVIIDVSEIWGRIARQNQSYMDDFEQFYAEQKEYIEGQNDLYDDELEKLKEQYQKDYVYDKSQLEEFIADQKLIIIEYFDTEKNELEAFFSGQKDAILQMIKELSDQNYVTNGRHDAEQEAQYRYIDGFKANKTIVQKDGSVLEIGERGSRLTTFEKDRITETFTFKNGEVIKLITTFEGKEILEVVE